MIAQEVLDAAVEAAVVDILEVNAFELGERGETEPVPDEVMTAQLSFHGPPSGRLHMWIEPAEARALAAALLGTDELDPAMIKDTVAELANMIAGHVLSRVFVDDCIGLDHAEVGVTLQAPCGLQIVGEHGRIGIGMEVSP